MKQQLFYLFAFLCTSCNYYSRFHQGRFEIIDEEKNLKYEIIRSENRQIERVYCYDENKFLRETHLFINWNSKSEYTLLFDTVRQTPDPTASQINKSGGLKNEIFLIKNDCAFVNTTFKNNFLISKICLIPLSLGY